MSLSGEALRARMARVFSGMAGMDTPLKMRQYIENQIADQKVDGSVKVLLVAIYHQLTTQREIMQRLDQIDTKLAAVLKIDADKHYERGDDYY